MITAVLTFTIAMLLGCGSSTENTDTKAADSKGGSVGLLDNADASIAGKYKLTGYEKDGSAVDISGKDSTIELRADGTGTFTVNGTPTEFTWDKNGCDINGSVSKYTLSGDTLTLTDGSVKMVFSKAGEAGSAQTDANTPDTPDTPADTVTEPTPVPLDNTDDVIEPVITLGAWENVEWEDYSDNYVTMKIPKGWTVTCQTQAVHLVYQVKCPDIPALTWYYCEVEDTAYKTQDYVDIIKEYYGDSIPEPKILTSETTQAYFEALFAQPALDITEFTVTDSIYNGVSGVGAQVEKYDDSGSKEVDNSTIRANWTQHGVEGEGLYSCSLIRYEMTVPKVDYSKYDQTGNWEDMLAASTYNVDATHYKVYTMAWETAPRGELDNWLPVLEQSMKSFTRTEKYWSDFYDYWSAQLGAQASAIQQQQQTLSNTLSDTSDMMYDAWKRRETSQDIMMQKQSDATLGYERIYDTQTGDIYRANSGFMEAYDGLGGKRYAAITDDMYTEGFKGYMDIELRKD